MENAMEYKTNEEICQAIDRFFYDNKPKEAEAFMLQMLAQAKEEKLFDRMLLLYNELIGYYRQTSEKDKLREVIDQAIELAAKMGLNGTIPFATTMINAANAYRSMGEIASAQKCYEEAEAVYGAQIHEGSHDENDLLLAGLYNNMSLMYQELSDFEKAENYQLKALALVTKLDSWFEIAVSHANLANTYLLARDYDKTKQHAEQAMEIFEAHDLKDPHYAAALSALGNLYLQQGDKVRAKETFLTAMEIIEAKIGRNSQYERLKEFVKLCEDGQNESEAEKRSETMRGLALAKQYYEQYGKPMIHDRFPEYESKIAVGLVGEGSDCFGYDDDFSKDHDYGPDFCMWVTDETYAQIGEALQREYDKLPQTFMDVTKTSTDMGSGRRGVLKISDFYHKFLGTDDITKLDYANIPDYALAAFTNGAVFRDDEGIFSDGYRKLKAGYPKQIRLLKLAEDVANVSQCGQYNYGRMLQRGDALTAGIMLHDFCKHAMKLYHHMMNAYPPHDKWLAKSTSLLPGGEDVVSMLKSILNAHAKNDTQAVQAMVERLAQAFADSLYASGEISDTDSYIDHHVQELLCKAGIASLDKETLVEMIARLEFEAFDKVQNEGGRASCQNNWPTFSIMRKSQYLTWNMEMLMQYYYDFKREYELGHNLITEKYGRMMESTDPERYAEISDNFPELTDEKKAVIEQIVGVQMQMVEAFGKEYPHVIGNARNLHTYEDEIYDTSYETYLRGEISTYSDKMLQLYGQFVVEKAMSGQNIARLTIENTAMLYGYETIDELEKDMKEEG